MTCAVPSRRLRCGARAVTLLELLVVLGLLAAIFALAIPIMFQSMRGRALRGAQESLVSALETVRAHAQREGIIVEVAVDPSGRVLRASELPIDGGEPQPIAALSFEFDAPMRLVVDEGGGTVALFLPDGSAPLARRCVIREGEVEGEVGGENEAVVTISPLLGRAAGEIVRASEGALPDAAEEKAAEATAAESTPAGTPPSGTGAAQPTATPTPTPTATPGGVSP